MSKSLFLTSLPITLLIFAGCSKVAFNVAPQEAQGTITPIVQAFQPALAVRGVSCLMCHAQINSNVITDFGYNDSTFFLNQNSNLDPVSGQQLSQYWYGNYDGAWQGASINGNVYVPTANITSSKYSQFITSLGGAWSQNSINLVQLMDLNDTSYYSSGDNPGGPMTLGIHAPSGTQPVVQMGQVYIGAPTSSQLLALSPTSIPVNGVAPASAGSSISGLSAFGGYVTNGNGGTINCEGDIVVNGTLFLDNVTVNTGDNGCRLMATKSVFIQGPVNYTNANGSPNLGNQNLQISSARAILMGFNPTTLASRLLNPKFTSSEVLFRETAKQGLTNTQWNQLSIDEANVIGSNLIDADIGGSCPATLGPLGSVASGTVSGTKCYYVTGDGARWAGPYQVVNYDRLLLNAPDIESRYLGTFHGVVISELALFAVGALDFQYDTTFSNVPVLPELGTSILSVKP